MQIQTNNFRDIVFSNEKFAKFKNLKPDELTETRKTNKELDWALYDADKAQMFLDIAREKMIAIKLAKGEKLSDEEQEFIEKNNPQLLEKAQNAQTFVKNLKKPNQDSDTSKLQVLNAIQKLSKYDPEYAELLLNAYEN